MNTISDIAAWHALEALHQSKSGEDPNEILEEYLGFAQSEAGEEHREEVEELFWQHIADHVSGWALHVPHLARLRHNILRLTDEPES